MLYTVKYYEFFYKPTSFWQWIWDIFKLLLSVGGMKFVVFSYVNNWFGKEDMFYVGNTAGTDKLYRKFIHIFPPNAMFVMRIFVLICLIAYFIKFY